MSLNDVITAAIAVAAVAVPAAAVYITVNSNRRAARSALTELTLKIAKKGKKYGQVEDKNAGEAYDLYMDIVVLARQADDLVRQLRSKFPESVGITIAQALELVNEWWYADHYWRLASDTADPLFRARTTSFWAFALFNRGEHGRGRAKAEEAARGLELSTTQAAIVRGEIYRWMATLDADNAIGWLMMAGAEYEAIPRTDARRQWYFDYWMADVIPNAQSRASVAPSSNAELTAT